MLPSMEKLKNIAVVLFMIIFLASLFMNVVHFTSRQQETRNTTRTIYVDTIPFYNPIPKDSFVIRYITKRLPTISKLPENVQKFPESVSEFPKSVQNFPKFVSKDSVDVVIPITKKVYKDSLYTAYVSGYNPKLDSLVLHSQHEVITINDCYPRSRKKRWSIGVQIGYGIALRGVPEFTPYIGVGVSCNLFKF